MTVVLEVRARNHQFSESDELVFTNIIHNLNKYPLLNTETLMFNSTDFFFMLEYLGLPIDPIQHVCFYHAVMSAIKEELSQENLKISVDSLHKNHYASFGNLEANILRLVRFLYNFVDKAYLVRWVCLDSIDSAFAG